MNNLVEVVGVFSMMVYTKQFENKPQEDIEAEVWKIVEHAMHVQQQICGGHKG